MMMIQNPHANEDKGRRSRRGFAAMDPQRQREIAKAGGEAAHRKGRAHEFSPEEAREAGRKGGQSVSRDREHMSRIGAKGGRASRGKRTTPTDDSNLKSTDRRSEENHNESETS